jgi:hypothetical protein
LADAARLAGVVNYVTCDQAQLHLTCAVDGPPGESALLDHARQCDVCKAVLEEHATIRYLLSDFTDDPLPPAFSRRVRSRIERRASPLGWTDWKSWTLRLAPAAVGLVVFAGLWFHRMQPAALETMMEQWMGVQEQTPAIGLFWHDAPREVLLEAVLEGRPDAAMRSYYIEGTHDH